MDANAPVTASLILKIEQRDRLSDEEKDVIAGMVSDVRVVDGGQDIINDGDRPIASTLLVDGFATRYKLLQGGERQITALHVAGDFVDLHSFLLKEMDHAVATVTTCRLASVRHETLAEISRTHPHLTRLFWLMTLIDGAIHREWLVAMGRRPALGQAAHLLCEVYLRLNSIGVASDFRFALPVTQAELGDILGLSSVHVNRVLQELRSRGLISWRGPTVTILDWPGLQETAEFDARYLHLVQEPR
jgi:CRP-like cAMP-binding protein